MRMKKNEHKFYQSKKQYIITNISAGDQDIFENIWLIATDLETNTKS